LSNFENPSTKESIQAYIDQLCKPPGSLGRWEKTAARLCWIQQTLKPSVRPAELLIFAADHGVVEEGVTLWPSAITTCMVEAIANGKSASAALASEYGLDYRVIDVGCKIAPSIKHERLVRQSIANGTNNLATGPAMSLELFQAAINIGRQQAQTSFDRGARTIILGEMGIGNTTAASCIASLLTKSKVDLVVGQGAGATDGSLMRKRTVVQNTIDRLEDRDPNDPTTLAEVCGFEIAAMAGCMLEAAQLKMTIVLDGMICTSAALIAQAFDPAVTNQMIAGHQSAEPSHRIMLEQLDLEPVLEWEMRLGEGTGALAAYPLLAGACAWIANMACIHELQLPKS
jgi:nicotinate-nucleotide--dimethylbenzimidazole phosphoribosyltransferase